jgi:hypothetical protein
MIYFYFYYFIFNFIFNFVVKSAKRDGDDTSLDSNIIIIFCLKDNFAHFYFKTNGSSVNR